MWSHRPCFFHGIIAQSTLPFCSECLRHHVFNRQFINVDYFLMSETLLDTAQNKLRILRTLPLSVHIEACKIRTKLVIGRVMSFTEHLLDATKQILLWRPARP